VTRKEILIAFCELQAMVWHAVSNGVDPSDCFCKEGGFWGVRGYGERDYRNDGHALRFIVKAVSAELDRQGVTYDDWRLEKLHRQLEGK
jgi:hypothetical protein